VDCAARYITGSPGVRLRPGLFTSQASNDARCVELSPNTVRRASGMATSGAACHKGSWRNGEALGIAKLGRTWVSNRISVFKNALKSIRISGSRLWSAIAHPIVDFFRLPRR
jgi:hypothetical protein